MQLQKLRHQRDVISLEAVSGEAALGQAIGRLPTFFQEAKAFFGNNIAEPVVDFFARKDLMWVANKTAKHQYSELRPHEVTVPQGMCCDYVTYLRALKSAAQAAATITSNTLVPYNAWLGQKLGNPAALASLTDSLDIKGFKPAEVDVLIKDLNACFATDGRKEVHVTYGQAIRRNTDWVEVANLVTEIEALFAKKDHDELVKQMNSAKMLTDLLIKRLEEDPKTYKASPVTISAIAATTYQIGAHLEFYALVRHRVSETSQALQATKEALTPRL